MNITFVSTKNPLDIRSWSGIEYHMKETLLKNGNRLEYIYPLEFRTDNILVRLKSRLYRRFSDRKYLLEREPVICRRFAREIRARMKPDTDLLFSPGSIPFSQLDTKVPTVFYTDATFAGMVDFYDSLSNLCAESLRNGNRMEEQSLHRSHLAVYASDWAADSAISDYGTPPDKVKVIPMGANLNESPDFEGIKSIIGSRSREQCHLLFLGVDWKRKGGDKAVRTVMLLRKSGVDAYLHVAGIKNLGSKGLPAFVIDHGFISKRTPEGMSSMTRLLAQCHFLIFPTMAECYGIVNCEANAYGLPVVTHAVGGVPTIIREGVNGSIFPLESTAHDHAVRILEMWKDPKGYRELCLSAHNEFKTRLNWKVAGSRLQTLLEAL